MNTKDLKTGDKVYLSRHTNWDVNYSKATVVKVTPTGMVDVTIVASQQAPIRFRPDCQEQGAYGKYRSYTLELDAAKVERILAGREQAKQVQECLRTVQKHAADMRASMQDIALLEQMVAALKDKVVAKFVAVAKDES